MTEADLEELVEMARLVTTDALRYSAGKKAWGPVDLVAMAAAATSVAMNISAGQVFPDAEAVMLDRFEATLKILADPKPGKSVTDQTDEENARQWEYFMDPDGDGEL